ncbi:hypothetical protein F5J12DRAFT_779766 [Pisolithus orientalis]|uniref:uncharacterized protein n=1 Tax=Pisolithus orientalis TaxID=936130 RepID=UPI0022245312|nr:uncharacterized protein F5J12DRAFT_779766 [Pisolithus orientalis]KAI6030671.1 hypothetical protein F5J12DRAFT_779766 [Pisolithus orientalis]
MSMMTNSVDNIQLHEEQLMTLPDAFLEVILSVNPVKLDYIHMFLRLALLQNITLNASLVTGNHFSRCAILNLEGHSGEIEEILESINTDDSAPLLHLLSIHNISCPIQEHLLNVPDRLLKTSMPHLKLLFLERFIHMPSLINLVVITNAVLELSPGCIILVLSTTVAALLYSWVTGCTHCMSGVQWWVPPTFALSGADFINANHGQANVGDADIPEWVTMVESLEDESSVGDVEN